MNALARWADMNVEGIIAPSTTVVGNVISGTKKTAFR
jgi:hypothetical protein